MNLNCFQDHILTLYRTRCTVMRRARNSSGQNNHGIPDLFVSGGYFLTADTRNKDTNCRTLAHVNHMKAVNVLMSVLLVGCCSRNDACSRGQIPSGRTTTTKGNVGCPRGTFVFRTFNCEPFIVVERCNPKEVCDRRGCRTEYEECDVIMFKRCSECNFCTNTFAPTRKPTSRPTAVSVISLRHGLESELISECSAPNRSQPKFQL